LQWQTIVRVSLTANPIINASKIDLRPGFDSRHYQKKKVVGLLEQGPLSLVSTTEELLGRKVAAPV
jgi:hypothetical protein